MGLANQALVKARSKVRYRHRPSRAGLAVRHSATEHQCSLEQREHQIDPSRAVMWQYLVPVPGLATTHHAARHLSRESPQHAHGVASIERNGRRSVDAMAAEFSNHERLRLSA